MSEQERRRGEERRRRERRTAGAALDVSRVEHENLFSAVAELARATQRIEAQIRLLHTRLDALEESKQRMGAGR